MYISVRRYHNVKNVRKVCGMIAESFVPLLKRSPGFIAYYAVDGGSGTMATVSIFSTKRMALESNDTAARWLADNVADLQPDPPPKSSPARRKWRSGLEGGNSGIRDVQPLTQDNHY